MMPATDGAPVLPLWINGRAFLTMPGSLLDVADATSGEVLRRVPLCGADEVAAAIAAAQVAQAGWQSLPGERRDALLAAWADGLAHYAEHFAAILQAETGVSAEAAAAEVAASVAELRAPSGTAIADGVVGVMADVPLPLAKIARAAAAALAAGATLVVKPSPRAPGAPFALVELSARVGLPDGVVNLVHGDDAAVSALLAQPALAALVCVAEPPLHARVAELARAAGKRCLAGTAA
jgi:succinate-semialdehyde dehydrogenase / glutarate-semialdehyde dehydrogenase